MWAARRNRAPAGVNFIDNDHVAGREPMRGRVVSTTVASPVCPAYVLTRDEDEPQPASTTARSKKDPAAERRGDGTPTNPMNHDCNRRAFLFEGRPLTAGLRAS
jgi:hypothetical protein